MTTPESNSHQTDRTRLRVHVLVALLALFVGYLLGLLGGQPPGDSRVGWPSAANRGRANH